MTPSRRRARPIAAGLLRNSFASSSWLRRSRSSSPMRRSLPPRPYNPPGMDAILIRDLRVEALIGIHKRERHVAQTVSIDLDIGLPGAAVFKSDKVADTIDYEQVALGIKA